MGRRNDGGIAVWGRSRCKAWLDRVDEAYEKHNITYTASQNFFATAQTVYIAAQKIKCIIEKSNADCVALNPSTKPVDPNTTLESSTWDKSCGGTLNTAKYAILFPTNRTGEELCKKFDKVDFVDMGQGFCVDARGELPERSYLREEGPQCEELCAKKPGCLAYTVSASNNCIMWKQPVSKGGGAQWGDNTKCLSKGRLTGPNRPPATIAPPPKVPKCAAGLKLVLPINPKTVHSMPSIAASSYYRN